MSKLCPFGQSKKRKKYAKAGAGPFVTGLSAGLGGAVGYLAGNAVDAAKGDVSAVTPIPDGGRPVRDDEDGVVIPVESESDA